MTLHPLPARVPVASSACWHAAHITGTGGEWPVRLAETDANIMLVQGELELAQRSLKTMLEINKDPELGQPYSDSEIKGEQLRVQRLQLNHKRAQDEKRILVDYTHKRALRNKQMGVQDQELALETAQLEAETDVRLAEGSAQILKPDMARDA